MRQTYSRHEPKPTPARLVPEGECFRKKQGEHIFVRMSPYTVRAFGLDEGLVWGLSLDNGNYAKVEPRTIVIREYLTFQRCQPGQEPGLKEAQITETPGSPLDFL